MIFSKRFCGLCLVLISLFLVGGCHRDTRPNVLIITIDTLRSDHCSSYGYSRKTTPTMEQIASEGTRFDVSYSPIPQTGPSHMSLLTGLYPITHGAVKNGYVLNESFQTLAEELKHAGYQTAGVVSAFPVSRKFGLAQGFDFFDDNFAGDRGSLVKKRWAGHEVEGVFDRPATDTTNKVLDWLKTRDDSKPLFLWIHYFDPHGPYNAPSKYRFDAGANADELTQRIAEYDAEIRYADTEMSRVLQMFREQNMLDKTLLVITADHGEGLMDHGRLDHGHLIYEEDLRIPLIFRWPGHVAAHHIVKSAVELVDVHDAVLQLVGLKKDGSSKLLMTLKNDQDAPVFLQRTHYEKGDPHDDKYGIRWGKWKYIEVSDGSSPELYDLSADPDERSNIAEQSAQKVSELSARIKEWRLKYDRRPAKGQHINEEDRERLKALGYVD